jgi:flagellar hook-basal body complex protein FliE
MSLPFAFGAIEAITSGIGMPSSILNNTTIGVQQVQQAQAPDRVDFKELLNTAIKSVSETQTGADEAISKLASGQNIELHNVMLAAQKAELTLQLALQVKNKVTEAYQEIMRMQI